MNLTLFLRLGRVSNLPTVWSNVIAGALLSGAALAINSLLILCVAFSCFYIGGMFLNDAFDAEYDKQYRPERPIPSGVIERQSVFVIGGALLVLGIMCVALHGMVFEDAIRLEPLMYAGALAVCIIWYNADHKQNVLGPVLMGLNRVYVYATAAFALQTEPDLLLWYGAAALLSYLIGLTFLAQQEDLGSVKSWWPAVFLVLPFFYPFVAVYYGGAEPNWSLAGTSLALLFIWVVRAVMLLRPRTGAPRIKQAIVSLIAGISLLDAVAAGIMDEGFYVFLAYITFGVCLWAQRWVSGT